MDAFQLLKTDHQRISTLFEEIESASDGADKQTLFAQLHQELDLHANVEETIFYPTFINTEAARDITLEAYQEHRVVKDLLSELASGDPSAEEWAAKLTVLKENVEHHVEEEEGELFRKARAVLSNEEIETLGDELQAAKTANEASESAPTTQQPVKRAAKPDRTKARRRTGLVGALASLVGLGGTERTGKRKTQRVTSAATRSSTKRGSKTTGAGSKSVKGQKQTAAKASSSKTSKKGTAAKPSKRSSAKKSSARKAAKAPAGTSKRRATVSSRSSAARKVSGSGGKSAKGRKRTSGK
jgi:hypothetical protein